MKHQKLYLNLWLILSFLIGILGITFVAFRPLSVASTAQAYDAKDWKFWRYENLKSLDPWGDSNGDVRDLVAIYEKEVGDSISFRIDLMDMRNDSSLNLYFAIDYKSGGNTELVKGIQNFVSDISWDMLFVLHDSSQQTVLDSAYIDHPEYLTHAAVENQLDFVEFSIRKTAFAGWDGKPFQMQAIVTRSNATLVSDKTTPVSINATTGRAKLVLLYGNLWAGYGPHAISWYDGFAFHQDQRPGERRGVRYLLDALEKYALPLTTANLQLNLLPGNEYLRINDRLRDLTVRGLYDDVNTLSYGYFMPWQPDDVNDLALRIADEYREAFGIRKSDVFFPYESMLTVGNLATIKQAGYRAILGLDRYAYWLGWITGMEPPNVINEWFESMKKIHKINGLLVFFTNQGINATDPRWRGEVTGHLYEYDKFEGTDRGLHLWWRRVLLDLAIDPDQEKYMAYGTEPSFTPLVFQDKAEWNARWLASHPWIEVTTFSDLLKRNWTPVDHGDLGLAPDQPMDRFSSEGDMHYNTYFWQFYYGGISDGHSPLIAKGDTIEGYFDYVPYLRGGQRIASSRKMGDDKTPGTIVYETLHNLRDAPDNSLTRLAWLAYFMNIAEQTLHTQTLYPSGETGSDLGGKYLHPAAKIKANHLRQVNKIIAAAQWAEQASKDMLPDSIQLFYQDLDLDDEDEFIFKNNQVFAIFENDGGKLEFAFANDPAIGPVQLVAPLYQFGLDWSVNYEEGEFVFHPCRRVAAFEEFSFELNKEYRNDIFDVVSTESSITFISPDGRIRKTFTVNDNTIFAHYSIYNLDSGMFVGFALPVNPANMYSQNWWEKIVKVHTPDLVGWEVAAGGYGAVTLSETRLNYADSFLDSPARDEMRERDDSSTYPGGHWLFYPYHEVTVWGSGEFNISLTLSAEIPTSVEETGEEVPRVFAIYQNYPNPFNPETVIEYQLPRPAEVEISIFNLQGQKVATLVRKQQTAGAHKIIWNGTDESGRRVASGVYLYQLQAGDFITAKKMLLLR